MLGSIRDFEQLVLFKVEIEFRVMGNLETSGQSQFYRLLRKPIRFSCQRNRPLR
jgi:hypothetical protein